MMTVTFNNSIKHIKNPVSMFIDLVYKLFNEIPSEMSSKYDRG